MSIKNKKTGPTPNKEEWQHLADKRRLSEACVSCRILHRCSILDAMFAVKQYIRVIK